PGVHVSVSRVEGVRCPGFPSPLEAVLLLALGGEETAPPAGWGAELASDSTAEGSLGSLGPAPPCPPKAPSREGCPVPRQPVPQPALSPPERPQHSPVVSFSALPLSPFLSLRPHPSEPPLCPIVDVAPHP
ncbi:unnamed protein product, partial [Ectocarpus sp. 12 AP-2014]